MAENKTSIDEGLLEELRLWLESPIRTSSVVKARGCSEWVDSVGDICEVRAMVEQYTRVIIEELGKS